MSAAMVPKAAHLSYSLLAGVILAGGCTKAPVVSFNQQPNASTSPSASTKLDACSVLTKEEVGSAQQTAISAVQSSQTADGVQQTTQCYYSSTGLNLSVSLALTQPDPKSEDSSGPRNYWRQFLEESNGTKKEAEEDGDKETESAKAAPKGSEGDEQERRVPPKKVEGVGEEALWSGNRFGGALYVLKGNSFLRISVGGPADEETKLERSKVLARKALGRLP